MRSLYLVELCQVILSHCQAHIWAYMGFDGRQKVLTPSLHHEGPIVAQWAIGFDVINHMKESVYS